MNLASGYSKRVYDLKMLSMAFSMTTLIILAYSNRESLDIIGGGLVIFLLAQLLPVDDIFSGRIEKLVARSILFIIIIFFTLARNAPLHLLLNILLLTFGASASMQLKRFLKFRAAMHEINLRNGLKF